MTRSEKRLLVATARAVRDLIAAVPGVASGADIAAALAPFDAEAAQIASIRPPRRYRSPRYEKFRGAET